MIIRMIVMGCVSIGLFADTNWEAYQQTTLAVQSTLPGWCTREKASKMMELIHEVKPLVCVEVGVFGGSSVFPTARALKYLQQGVIYAIDPWTHSECLEG